MMKEFVQINEGLCIPLRTAELSERCPGVRTMLLQGLIVRHYIDAREEVNPYQDDDVEPKPEMQLANNVFEERE